MIKFLTFVFKYKIFVVAALLTFILSAMVYNRVSILTSGAEIVLKSAPIDPRDLFRGHYVIMNYDVSRLDTCKLNVKEDLRRNQLVFVQLEEDEKGYWQAVSLSSKPLYSTKTTVILSGYSRSTYKVLERKGCYSIRLRYGLEKYFAPKKRAKALEDMRRGRSNNETRLQIEVLAKELLLYRGQLTKLFREARDKGLKIKATNERSRVLREKMRTIEDKITRLRLESRVEIGAIVRVSKSGEGVISGLMIDGKKIYEEGL